MSSSYSPLIWALFIAVEVAPEASRFRLIQAVEYAGSASMLEEEETTPQREACERALESARDALGSDSAGLAVVAAIRAASVRQNEVAWAILRSLGIPAPEAGDMVAAKLDLMRTCWRHLESGLLFVLLCDERGSVLECLPVDDAGVALLELSVPTGEDMHTKTIAAEQTAWAAAQHWELVPAPPMVSLEAIIERIQGDFSQ